MAHPLSGVATLFALFAIALTTAFSAPRDPLVASDVDPAVDLTVAPIVDVRETPRAVVDHVEPVHGPEANPVFTLRATAYNSLVAQTNAQPFVTATGARTRWGIIAVSRDLLGTDLPYGSLVRLRDLGAFSSGRGAGAYDGLLEGIVFTVEDTMHPRKTQQVDVWFAEYGDALRWGVRRLEVELVRYGRTGPTLDPFQNAAGSAAEPAWVAAR
jgi:3D (Asp-Asp-Asp) domain-containing protein